VLHDYSRLSNANALGVCMSMKSLGTKSDPANNFEYRGWHVQLELKGEDSTFSGRAQLSLDGETKCQLVLATGRLDPVTARWALDSKARDYIDDWNSMRHTGRTDFGELGAA